MDSLVTFGLQVKQGEHWLDPRQEDGWHVEWVNASGALPCARLSRADGIPIGCAQLRITVSLPLLNYGGVLIPDCGRHYVNSPKALDIRAPQFAITAANAGHPFFAVNDEAGNMLVAAGVLNHAGAAVIRRLLPVISQRKAMVGGDQQLQLAFEWTTQQDKAQSLTVDLFVDALSSHWFHALRKYTSLVCKRERIEYPRHEQAWEPVWCTWTAFPSSQMNAARVLENARLAKAMGMGAIILDDGWFGPGLDDDGPRPINHGDYDADPDKFSDLPALVERVQAMGLKFLLWHAPLCVAPQSKAARRLASWFMKDASGAFLSVNGLYQLCPACPQVREYVMDETQRLLRKYRVDGFKVDLFNCLSPQPCSSDEHEHDIDDPLLALDKLMEAQWQAARQVKPDVLLELKQDYGNVRLARHGTMVRAGDTAYDIDTNLLRCAYTQAFVPCVHVDPLVTSIHAQPQAVALIMIKALAGGVPTFSVDLPSLSEEVRQVMAAWLGYYNEHREAFKVPRTLQGRAMNLWQGGGPQLSWIIATGQANECHLPATRGQVHLLNATDRDCFYLLIDQPTHVLVTRRDHRLSFVDQQHLTLTNGCRLPVIAGGLTEIQFP